jgi:SARP family transcriptional regulator, regulator of embCAB operon
VVQTEYGQLAKYANRRGRMHVELLGPVSVVVAGHRCRIRGEKTRVILALLSLNAGRVVGSDELVDELWPDAPVRNARNALQANVTRLRKLLDAPALETVDNGYLLNVAPEAVDANRFRLQAHLGASLVSSEPDRAVRLIESALALWRGPALLDSGQGPRCRAAASSLDEAYVLAQEDLMMARLALGGERSVVSELEHLATRYPLRERFCELLMLALYRCGRQVDALDAFHRIRHHLADEIGLEPGTELQSRYRAILLQDPALASPVVGVSLVAHRRPTARQALGTKVLRRRWVGRSMMRRSTTQTGPWSRSVSNAAVSNVAVSNVAVSNVAVSNVAAMTASATPRGPLVTDSS